MCFSYILRKVCGLCRNFYGIGVAKCLGGVGCNGHAQRAKDVTLSSSVALRFIGDHQLVAVRDGKTTLDWLTC